MYVLHVPWHGVVEAYPVAAPVVAGEQAGAPCRSLRPWALLRRGLLALRPLAGHLHLPVGALVRQERRAEIIDPQALLTLDGGIPKVTPALGKQFGRGGHEDVVARLHDILLAGIGHDLPAEARCLDVQSERLVLAALDAEVGDVDGSLRLERQGGYEEEGKGMFHDVGIGWLCLMIKCRCKDNDFFLFSHISFLLFVILLFFASHFR